MRVTYPLPREHQGIRYIQLAPLDPEIARFAFTGVFQNQGIVWDTTLYTLTRYHADQKESNELVVRSAILDVGELTAAGRRLVIALDIPQIDEPAILRTIIMVRNYKRLQHGCHHFGEWREFPPR